MVEFSKFFCPNCGKEGGVSVSITCDCKPRPKGKRWVDKQQLHKMEWDDRGNLVLVPTK